MLHSGSDITSKSEATTFSSAFCAQKRCGGGSASSKLTLQPLHLALFGPQYDLDLKIKNEMKWLVKKSISPVPALSWNEVKHDFLQHVGLCWSSCRWAQEPCFDFLGFWAGKPHMTLVRARKSVVSRLWRFVRFHALRGPNTTRYWPVFLEDCFCPEQTPKAKLANATCAHPLHHSFGNPQVGHQQSLTKVRTEKSAKWRAKCGKVTV